MEPKLAIEWLFKTFRPLSLGVAFAAIVSAVVVGARPALDVVKRDADPGPVLMAAAGLLVLAVVALLIGQRAEPVGMRVYAVVLGAIAIVTLAVVSIDIALRYWAGRRRVLVTVAGEGGTVTALPGTIAFEGHCEASKGQIKVTLKRSGTEAAVLVDTAAIDGSGKWLLDWAAPAPRPGESTTFEVTAESTADCREALQPLVLTVLNPLVTIRDPAAQGPRATFKGTVAGAPSESYVVVYGKNEDDAGWRLICWTAVSVAASSWSCAGDLRPRGHLRRTFIGRAFVSLGQPVEHPPVAFPFYGSSSNELQLDIPPPEARPPRFNPQRLREHGRVALHAPR